MTSAPSHATLARPIPSSYASVPSRPPHTKKTKYTESVHTRAERDAITQHTHTPINRKHNTYIHAQKVTYTHSTARAITYVTCLSLMRACERVCSREAV